MPTILHRISIDAPPERVHQLTATREGIQQWSTGHRVTGEKNAGGQMSVYFSDAGNRAATFQIVRCSPRNWRKYSATTTAIAGSAEASGQARESAPFPPGG